MHIILLSQADYLQVIKKEIELQRDWDAIRCVAERGLELRSLTPCSYKRGLGIKGLVCGSSVNENLVALHNSGFWDSRISHQKFSKKKKSLNPQS